MARKQADASDERLANGAERRPLEGMPIIVKANVDYAGSLSTASMPGLKDWRPSTTSPSLQRLINAGAIVAARWWSNLF